METETLEIDLGKGRVARLVISIIEEPMPTPHEMPHHRCPSLSELEQITTALRARRYTIKS